MADREKIMAEDFLVKKGRRKGVGVFRGRLNEFAGLCVWWSGKKTGEWLGEYSWEAAERIVQNGELTLTD